MGAPDAPHHSIGDVLAVLRDEFADITISKIRFLESQGLIDPERTPSGYRKFYDPDVERLRWILRQQKDHFLPLKVIKGRIEELEQAGKGFGAEAEPVSEPEVEPVPVEPAPGGRGRRRSRERSGAASGSRDGGAARPVRRRAAEPALALDDGASEDLAPAVTGVSLTRAELAKAAGLDDAQVSELEEFGLLAPAIDAGGRGLFDDTGLAIAGLAAGFFAHGIEARHLRMYRQFAERETLLFEQVLVGVLRQRNPEARARAREQLADLARLGRGLRTAYLRQTTSELLAE